MYVDLPIKLITLNQDEDLEDVVDMYNEISEITGEEPDVFELAIFTIDTSKISHVLSDTETNCFIFTDSGMEVSCELSREDVLNRIGWVNNV